MKKNILVILIVIGVVGVLVYLFKDRLKLLLGERAKGEEIPEERKLPGPLIYPGKWIKEGTHPYPPGDPRYGITMGVGMTLPMAMGLIGRTGESPSRWLQEEIAPILKPMYPARYIAITKGLLAYLTMGEAALPPNGLGRIGPGVGPLIALPQF